MYQAYVTQIKNVRKHSNADRLQVGECFGNSVIVGLNQKEDDIVLYFPVDGCLGEEFANVNNLVRKKDGDGNNIGGYLDPVKRNIKAIKLRGEMSDGLILSVDSLSSFTDVSKLKVGDTITMLNGVTICEKYIPRRNPEKLAHNKKQPKMKKIEKNTFPLFREHIDTKQLRFSQNAFKVGDRISISLKMHGTSMRCSRALKQTKKFTHPFMLKLLNNLHIKNPISTSYDYVTGTRRVVLKDFNGGFYGSNEFRRPYHDLFEGKLMKNETAYGEIVGWQSEDKTIMGRCSNSKVKDKEFSKLYGKETVFSYGCEQGESDIYIYRMNLTNEDGYVVEYSPAQIAIRCEQMGIKMCPVLEEFDYTTYEDLIERVNKYLDIPDPIDNRHVAEGVVVRIVNRENFAVYKEKSNTFKILEGIIKDSATEADIEEAQDLIAEGN